MKEYKFIKGSLLKGSKIFIILSSILIIINFIQLFCGGDKVENIISIVLWSLALICSIKKI